MAVTKIYTDGSSLGNPGPGGWGAIVCTGNEEHELSGPQIDTTNNRMELLAVIQGLEWMLSRAGIGFIDGSLPAEDIGVSIGLFSDPEEDPVGSGKKSIDVAVVVYTDSTYVQKGITEWIHTWIKRNRRRSKGGQLVQNVDLRQRLWGLLDYFDDLDRQWVKGHAGHEMNERVDDLARGAAESLL